MLKQPQTKYRAFPPIALNDRRWPGRTITHPPIWMSTDLRDGNQALFEPMDSERKLRLFEHLVAIGFKEIEVAFPSAAQIEFDFVRRLIEEDRIPGDVTIEVLTQAREPLIRRTVESLVGARRAILHIYNATSKPFREMVFGLTPEEVKAMAVEAVRLARRLCAEHPETEWVLEYSPETFSATELAFAKEVCDGVTEAWGASPQRPVIINLPATVEMSTPNVYADQIEWMDRHLDRRESIILSVHPHNDRGCAVAAAELAMLAGAQRVEGCLFGNGERTGNVDLVTLALNLYSQGIDPGLDFSDINAVIRTAESCTQLPVHPRHPYAGDLVFTAFSGSHQDAIRKGLAAQSPEDVWAVPYLPVDPADLGRSYDSIVRVNSQSGKGGVAFLLETGYGLVMPRRLQIEFSAIVQAHAETQGGEVGADALWALFQATYLNLPAHLPTPIDYVEHHLFEAGDAQGIRLGLRVAGRACTVEGIGNGPIDAALHALGLPVDVRSYEERSLGVGGDSRAAAFLELGVPGGGISRFGVGLHANIVTASVLALIGGVNRLAAAGDEAFRTRLLAPLHRAV